MTSRKCILLFVILTCHIAYAADKSGKWVFEAKTADVRLNKVLYDQGYRGKTVSTTALGTFYENPVVVDLDHKWHFDRSTPINVIKNYYPALRHGKPKDIPLFWHPDSRKSVMASLSDLEKAKKAKEYWSKQVKVKILGLLENGGLVRVIVQEGDFKTILILKHISDGWYLSNLPIDDMKDAIIEAALWQGKVKPAQK